MSIIILGIVDSKGDKTETLASILIKRTYFLKIRPKLCFVTVKKKKVAKLESCHTKSKLVNSKFVDSTKQPNHPHIISSIAVAVLCQIIMFKKVVDSTFWHFQVCRSLKWCKVIWDHTLAKSVKKRISIYWDSALGRFWTSGLGWAIWYSCYRIFQ